jgi:hypothetical protein
MAPPRPRIVLISLVIAVLLGLGVAAWLVFGDRAQDASGPVAVTRQYLAAYLVDRDDVKAAQFHCTDDGGLLDVKALRGGIDTGQRSVSIDKVTETSRTESTATTTAVIVLDTVIDGEPQHAVEHWEFSLKGGGVWLVCSGHEQP